jgi:uncharacterized membrane protein
MEMSGSHTMQHYSARTGRVARVVFRCMPVLCHSYKDWFLLAMEMLKGWQRSYTNIYLIWIMHIGKVGHSSAVFCRLGCSKKIMATENTILMRQAQDALRGKWPLAIGTFIVYAIIMGAAGAVRELGLVSLLVGGPMALGAAMFSQSIARGKEARLEQLFDGFKDFSRALVTYLLMILYIILWALLLIIPGIIAGLSYSMVFYILADDKAVKPSEALERSKKMMYGYKWKLFGLCMWFLLLALLCVLTLGIGFLWLIPFVNVTMATFYDDIRSNADNTFSIPQQPASL